MCRYLDAPGAALACLRGPQRHIKLAPVTMVFSAIDHADEIKVRLDHTLSFLFALPCYNEATTS